ncbi:MAG: hypothetical protein LBT89_09050 [Planctomycetaceae bacterium]|jgi:type II restriction enzyme|nr:hypothetical protein [Planctomycetaceae bacterium]
MARKADLRVQRTGTVINATSKRMEERLITALTETCDYIKNKFGVELSYQPDMYLKDVVTHLKELYPDIDFHYFFDRSSMRPDGGVVSLVAKNQKQYPILITEVKNQGTNVIREQEGKPRQAKGNAIERLGKNVIGFRTSLLHETIFPFVCFGDGCDFAPDSSILDRVVTIAMFGKLNEMHLHNKGQFNRGSFFFREKTWTAEEMSAVMKTIAEQSVYYYFSKYGEMAFR